MLTSAQQITLVNGLKAETNATVVAALAVGARNDVYLTEWLNTASTTDAWNDQCSSRDLVKASPLTLYDGLTQGKRDEWRMILDFNNPTIDMREDLWRTSIVDSWGTTSRSVPILQAGVRKATNAEKYLGGTSSTTNTVTALKLNWVGSLGISEVSQALNANGVPG